MAILGPTIPASELVYPDTDGSPMAENTIQYRYLTTVKGGLEVAFRDREDVFIAGDLFWYPVERHPEIRVAPDVLVAIGRPKRDRMSYLQWQENNQPPQVVFEIVSPSSRSGDIEKALFYNRYGVVEYYLYDPFAGELAGWLRGPEELSPIPSMPGWTSPLLGVKFELDGMHLRMFSPDGSPFATYEELAEQRDQERERAEQERERAERERQRAERLADRLRELGVAPEE